MRVAILDSGVDPGLPAAAVVASRSFVADEGPTGGDVLGHGSAIAALILARAPQSELLIGRIFGSRRLCSVTQVVAAIDWALAAGAQLINLSFGLSQPHAALRLACERAAQRNCVLVASAAARGGPSFPAAYSDCIAASGDARCAPQETSWLGTPTIDFGACPSALDAGPRDDTPGPIAPTAGASFAAARISGVLAAELGAGASPAEAIERLRGSCRYFGPERRRHP